MRLLRERADARGLFEALASDAATDEQWAAGFSESAREVFNGQQIGCQWVKHDGTFEHIEGMMSIGYDWSLEKLHAFADHLGEGECARLSRAMYSQLNSLVDPFETLGRLGLSREELARYFGLVQSGGVPISPSPGVHVVFIWASYDRLFTTTPEDLRLLRRVALHFENGVRARSCLDFEGELPCDGAWPGNDANALWESLCSGRVSLVKRGQSYRVLKTAASRRFSRALRHTEREAIEQCAKGRPFKEVAWELDMSPSRLSTVINSAAAKLGAPSTVDALRLVGGLLRQPGALLASFTSAERDVLSLLKQGLTNKDIAQARQRSERTVANQVASLLRKTGLAGRRALISRVEF